MRPASLRARLWRGAATAAMLIAAPFAIAAPPSELPAIASPQAHERLLVDMLLLDGRLIAVGEQGHIVLSDNDGRTWTHANVPVSVMLTAITASAAQTLWATGHDGMLLSSDDRGASWRVALDGEQIVALQIDAAEQAIAQREAALEVMSEDDPNFEDAQFALEDAQFALEDAERMLDGGLTSPLLGVTFVSESVGFVYGAYGVLLATDNGGKDWSLISRRLDNPDNKHLYALVRSNSGALLLAGEAGAMFRSDDVGATWQSLQVGYEGSLFGIVAASDGSVSVFGLRGRIFRSADDGQTWTGIETGQRATLLDGIASADGRIVLVGASGMMLASDDYGVSYTPVDTDTRDPLSAVCRNRNDELMIAGFRGVRALASGQAGD